MLTKLYNELYSKLMNVTYPLNTLSDYANVSDSTRYINWTYVPKNAKSTDLVRKFTYLCTSDAIRNFAVDIIHENLHEKVLENPAKAIEVDELVYNIAVTWFIWLKHEDVKK